MMLRYAEGPRARMNANKVLEASGRPASGQDHRPQYAGPDMNSPNRAAENMLTAIRAVHCDLLPQRVEHGGHYSP